MSNIIADKALTRLLYVDDELDILNIVQQGLTRYGFSVDVAASVEEATEKDLSAYDLILLDLRMPKINGFQLYEMMKDKIDPSKTKVAFFTAFTSYLAEYNQKYPKWTGCCFMTKPMSTKDLASKLRDLLVAN